jgi:tetratricopeptide (TPR) repeat protein
VKYLHCVIALIVVFSLQAEAQQSASRLYYDATAKGLSGEYTAAIELFTLALEAGYAEEDVRLNRGICYYNKRKYKEALLDLSRTIQLNQSNSSAFNQRGLCKLALGDKSGALSDFNDAIQLKDNEPRYYYNRAQAAYGLGNYPEAINDLTICIQLDGQMSEAFYKRGIIQFVSGSREAACIDLSKAVDLGNGEASDVIKMYCR